MTLQHDLVNPQAPEGTARVPCQLLSKETRDTEECGEHEGSAFIAVKIHASMYSATTRPRIEVTWANRLREHWGVLPDYSCMCASTGEPLYRGHHWGPAGCPV